MPLQWHEGIAWYYLDQMDPCVTAFEAAYQLNPWSFQIMHNYASALLKRGDTDKAIALLETKRAHIDASLAELHVINAAVRKHLSER